MMKKITVKQLMLLSLFMAMAWSASAQMKVGDNPNTINKGSVLELEAKDKGVLYPRVALTASNAWEPLQGTAVAGMTVYNTATVTATTSATTSLSPGFYLWEGAKWNKLATNAEVAEGAEWVYDPITKQTKLSRSLDGQFYNKVFFTEKGRYVNTENLETYILGTKDEPKINVLENSNSFNLSHLRAEHIPSNITKAYNYAYLSKDILDVDDIGINNLGDHKYIANKYFISQTLPENTVSPIILGGAFSSAIHRSGTPINDMIGVRGDAFLFDGDVTHSAVGVYGSTSLYTDSNINGAYGVRGFNSIGKDSNPTVNNASGVRAYNFFRLGGAPTVKSASGVFVNNVFESGVTPPAAKITNLHGVYITGASGDISQSSITNHYGLRISDIKNATNNYAIYTNAGEVRLGELAGTGSLSTETTDKVVVADTDGVLKTKAAATLVAEAGEWKYGTVSGTNLIYANQAKTAGNDVVITDDGSLGIGTTTPTAKLAIQSTNQQALNIGNGTKTNLNILNDGRIVYGYDDPTAATNFINFHKKATEPFTKGIKFTTHIGAEDDFLIYSGDGGGRLVSNNSVQIFLDADNDGVATPIDSSPWGASLDIFKDANYVTSSTFPLFRFTETAIAYKKGSAVWTVASDKRSKENIVNYTKGLKELLKVRPVNFNYKKEFAANDKTYTGVIAQELERVAPSMVSEIEQNGIKDFKTVDPNEFTYMLINSVKELKKQNDVQQQEIAELKSLVQQLLEKK